MPKVSVIVPNYNKAPYLEKRLRSILEQSMSDLELIFLDDASSDNSGEVFAQFSSDPRVKAVFYKENSGCVFKQWNRGFKEAKGDFILIAEADDYADERFLEVMLGKFKEYPSAGLACCRPMVVDAEGNQVGAFEVNPWWRKRNINRPYEDYFSEGRDELATCLGLSCTIPNASGVLMRRKVRLTPLSRPQNWKNKVDAPALNTDSQGA